MKIDIHIYLQKTLIRALLLFPSLFLLVYCYISSKSYLIPSIIYFIFCIVVVVYSDFINSKRN